MASSADNAVYQIPNAATAASTQTASLLFSDFTHLHGPLDIGFLPNGHLLVANSDGSNVDPNQPSELVEYTAAGEFGGQMPIDPQNGGDSIFLHALQSPKRVIFRFPGLFFVDPARAPSVVRPSPSFVQTPYRRQDLRW